MYMHIHINIHRMFFRYARVDFLWPTLYKK
jgi:hypothetical protein